MHGEEYPTGEIGITHLRYVLLHHCADECITRADLLLHTTLYPSAIGIPIVL